MSPLFNSGAGQHSLRALDATGQLAAVYPSEEQLWVYGPAITDPGDQGIAGAVDRSGGMGLLGQVSDAPLPAPLSQGELDAAEAWLHEVINGQTPNAAYGEEWVNLTITGLPGYGSFNEQPFFTGHSQIVQANPASEQGWGVGPARRWAHYPFSQLDNPARNAGAGHLRMGQLPWAYSEQNMLYYRTQLIWEQQWAPYKQRIPVNPQVPVAPSVPFAQVVPTYAGGYVDYAGIDVPMDDHGAGIY